MHLFLTLSVVTSLASGNLLTVMCNVNYLSEGHVQRSVAPLVPTSKEIMSFVAMHLFLTLSIVTSLASGNCLTLMCDVNYLSEGHVQRSFVPRGRGRGRRRGRGHARDWKKFYFF